MTLCVITAGNGDTKPRNAGRSKGMRRPVVAAVRTKARATMERIERSLRTKEKGTETPKVGELPKVEERRGEVELLGASKGQEPQRTRKGQGEVEEEERKRERPLLG